MQFKPFFHVCFFPTLGKNKTKKQQAPARCCVVSISMQRMTTWGRLTCPQALQWCRRLVRALKGSLHFMHMVTSLSRIQRGARLPSSALCKSRNNGGWLGEIFRWKVCACAALTDTSSPSFSALLNDSFFCWKISMVSWKAWK